MSTKWGEKERRGGMSAGALRALVMQGCADGKGCIVFFVYRIIQFELFSFVFMLKVATFVTYVT